MKPSDIWPCDALAHNYAKEDIVVNMQSYFSHSFCQLANHDFKEQHYLLKLTFLADQRTPCSLAIYTSLSPHTILFLRICKGREFTKQESKYSLLPFFASPPQKPIFILSLVLLQPNKFSSISPSHDHPASYFSNSEYRKPEGKWKLWVWYQPWVLPFWFVFWLSSN